MPGQLGARVRARHGVPVGLVDGDFRQPRQRLRAAIGGRLALEQFGALFDEVGGHVAGQELLVGDDGAQEPDVRGHAADAELGQGATGAADGRLMVAATADELDQHRVEVRGDFRAGVDRAAVQPDSGAPDGPVRGDAAHVGPEVVGGILGGDAALHGRAPDAQSILRDVQVGQRLTGGDAQLRLHDVDVGDLLGDGVLHLNARVHLDEHVLPGAFADGVDQELHGAGVDVAELLRQLHRVAVEGLADALVEVGGGRDLHDLLVPALQRAVALEEMHRLAGGVGEDLDLDVAGPQHRLLEEDRGVAERGGGLPHRRAQSVGQGLARLHAPHAAAAAARDGLDEDGETDVLRLLQQRLDVVGRLGRPQRRNARTFGGAQSLDLVAGQLQDLGRQPTPEEVGCAFTKLQFYQQAPAVRWRYGAGKFG